MSFLYSFKASWILGLIVLLILLFLVEALFLIVLDVDRQIPPHLVDALVVGPVAKTVLDVELGSPARVVHQAGVCPVLTDQLSVYLQSVVYGGCVELSRFS